MLDLKVTYANPPQVPAIEFVCAMPEGMDVSRALLTAIGDYHSVVRRPLTQDEVHRIVRSHAIIAPPQ